MSVFFPFQFASAVALFLLFAIELAYFGFAKGRQPDVRAHAANGLIFGVDIFLRTLTFGVRIAVFTWAGALVPWAVAPTPLAIVVAYVLVDFVYYWRHRLMHEWSLGWALHSSHHSSRRLTFFATFRLSWIEVFFSYYFFLPLALLGLPALWLLVLIAFNDGWQFVCHTEFINRFRFLDRIMNTPNIHRVHHSKDRALANKNYGSTFMLWDRLFGTYHPGLDHVDAGIRDRAPGNDVLSIQFGGLRRWWNAKQM